MGLTSVAVADDPSSIASNPACLTKLAGKQLYAGASGISTASEYESPAGQREKSDSQLFIQPYLFYAAQIENSDSRAGVGLYSPFGIGGRKWSATGLTRYSSVENKISTFMVNPTFAYSITPSLSIGAGADYLYSRAESRFAIDQSAVGAADGELASDATGGGWGYNAGVLYSPSEALRFGLAYNSKIKVRYTGDMQLSNIAPTVQPLFSGPDYKTRMTTELTFPDILSFGVMYRPTETIVLAVDLEQMRWSSFGKSDIYLANEVPAAGFTGRTMVMDWHDVWFFKIGAEVKASDTLYLRAGYSHTPSPAPEHTLSAGDPDSDAQSLSIGAGWHLDRTVLDFFAMESFYKKRSVNNTILSGRYSNTMHVAGLSVGYRF